MGDARGHFDGDTLVVETTNFKDQIAYRNANGATLGLIERFTPVGRRARFESSTTVDDPRTWTRPWTFAIEPDEEGPQPADPVDCTPVSKGDYGLKNILSGAPHRRRRAGRTASPSLQRQVRRSLSIAPLPFALSPDLCSLVTGPA